ncbi:MAG TPA: DUF429 domain-containing protein [Alphaproteobacteria bacterium]|nr:DUF429 domain-containing protein [Alphaproteobacteria bacterium]
MTRILGVDFSGASDAGRKIWIAEGRHNAKGAFALVSCIPAIDLPSSGAAPAEAIPALVRHIAGLGGIPGRAARVGCDFPFSLPRGQLEARTWRGFVLGYAGRYATADTFRAAFRSQPEAAAFKRLTDREARTPFNAHNLRLYRQTWWGIAGVLAPLVRKGAATVYPQQDLRAGKPALIEVCPASTLKSIGLYPSYKGRGAAPRRARQRILDGLIARGALAAPPASLRKLLLDNEGGDALDAAIAAVATAQADLSGPPDALQRLEGRVYYEIG